MDISEGIAIAAATISTVATWSAHRAAISAERSARSAEHANKIALHNERLNIYKGLQEFHLMLRTRGIHLPDETIWHFFDRSNLSEFYFSPEIAASLLAIAKCANDMKAMGDYGESTPHGEDSAQAARRKRRNLELTSSDNASGRTVPCAVCCA